MSVQGKSTLSLRKKDVLDQKNLAIGFKKTMFAHKATVGATGIDLTALVTPSEMSGFTNPTAGELAAAQIYFYRKNMTLVSSIRGPLMDFLSYNVASSTRIDFNGFTAEDGEIFIGIIDYNARNGLQVVDAAPLVASGTLAVAVTDFNVGQTFEVNKYSSGQVGAVIVFRNGVQQFRNSNNSSVTLDGNYYEVNNGSGLGSIIRFNNAPAGQDDNILVVSNGLLVYNPDGSALQAIETLAGQIDAMIPALAAASGNPESAFQAAPNNADLKSFGDRVLALETNKANVFTTPWQQKFLPSDISVSTTDIASLRFNNLTVGKTYRATIQGRFLISDDNGAVQIVHNGVVLARTSNQPTGVGPEDRFAQTCYAIFVAVTTTVTFDFIENAIAILEGNGTGTHTWTMLEELPHAVVTTQWT